MFEENRNGKRKMGEDKNCHSKQKPRERLGHSANEYKIWQVKTIYTIFSILCIQRFFIEINDLWLVIINIFA